VGSVYPTKFKQVRSKRVSEDEPEMRACVNGCFGFDKHTAAKLYTRKNVQASFKLEITEINACRFSSLSSFEVLVLEN
jgi:hypothetical protein